MGTAEALGEEQLCDAPDRRPMLHAFGEYQPLPEVFRPVSVSYEIPIIYLNIFSQQRAGRNKEQDALTTSLRGGQINPVNIVIASEGLVEEYRQFTNATWGGNVRQEDLVPLPLPENVYPRPDPRYVILVAGHSRVEGKKAIAKEDGTPLGGAVIEARIHEVDSVEKMLEIQLRENVHSQPAKDRELRAIGELFKWKDDEHRRLTGRPLERREFARMNGISEETLRIAANYVALPKEIRDFSDDDGLPFNIIMELATARTAIVANARYLAEREPELAISADMEEDEVKKRKAAQDERVRELELHEYGYVLSVLDKKGYTSKRNASKGCTVIRAHAKTIRDTIAGRRAAELTLVDTLFSDEETLAVRIGRLRAETAQNVKEFLFGQDLRDRHYARRIADLAGLDVEIAGPDLVVDSLRRTFEKVGAGGA